MHPEVGQFSFNSSGFLKKLTAQGGGGSGGGAEDGDLKTKNWRPCVAI